MTTTISRINQILSACNIPISIESYIECVPSLWIAIFESLFQTRLKPSAKDVETNLNSLISKLERIGSVSLGYLDVRKLIKKDIVTIDRIVDLFWELYLAIEDYKLKEEERDWNARLDECNIPRLSESNSGSGNARFDVDVTSILRDSSIPMLVDDSDPSSVGRSATDGSAKRIESESMPSAISSSNSSKKIIPSRIRVKKSSEVQDWLTTVHDDIDQFEKKETVTKPLQKNLRFEEVHND
jgi:hypothetical protein